MLQVKLWIKGGRVLSLEEMGFKEVKPHSLLKSHPIVRGSNYKEAMTIVDIESISITPMDFGKHVCVRHGVFRHEIQRDIFLIISNQYPTLVRSEEGRNPRLEVILDYNSMQKVLGRGPKISQSIWETFLEHYMGLIRGYRNNIGTPKTVQEN